MPVELQMLNIPSEKSVRYSTNFIKSAVCELKFPVLLELEEKLPVEIQKALKKKYPIFSISKTYTLGGDDQIESRRYLFKSKLGDWTVSLRPSALSIETRNYTDFSEFIERLKSVLDAIGSFLDTNFYTRIGLRYINAVPLGDDDVEGWINPALITALQTKVFGTVSAFQNEVRGQIENGSYTFKHGFNPNISEDGILNEYMLDFDYSSENVDFENAIDVITSFNELNFSFFRWALGEKAKKHLGEGETKK